MASSRRVYGNLRGDARRRPRRPSRSLEVAPDQYVTERTRMVKQARADKDKARVAFYQGLKRPSVVPWAALVAGDADVVHKILAVTAELGEVQAGRSSPADLTAATKRRRTVLESFVDKAVNALAMFDNGARETTAGDPRRSSTNCPGTLISPTRWIDGTLREVPDEQFGFGGVRRRRADTSRRCRQADEEGCCETRAKGSSRPPLHSGGRRGSA